MHGSAHVMCTQQGKRPKVDGGHTNGGWVQTFWWGRHRVEGPGYGPPLGWHFVLGDVPKSMLGGGRAPAPQLGGCRAAWAHSGGALALLHIHKALGTEVAQADLVDGLEGEDGQDLLAVHILRAG